MQKQSKTYIKILEAALPLFAAYGYKGVAMRDIANAVGITAAALYNHFPNKEQLHLKALEYAFSQKVGSLSRFLAKATTPEQRLRQFILFWVGSFGQDVILRSLMQREMADGDAVRIKVLVDRVFQPIFEEVSDLIEFAGKGMNAHLFFFSVIGLVMFHFEVSPLRKCLSNYQAEHEKADNITQHIMGLLTNSIDFS
ncbi:MAG: TetR/AcrR family transcriptional regulator [Magnetococcales bacterium]|nr:TetR/AcrR family transcriptional regulator [Magnetococcales bacterium]